MPYGQHSIKNSFVGFVVKKVFSSKIMHIGYHKRGEGFHVHGLLFFLRCLMCIDHDRLLKKNITTKNTKNTKNFNKKHIMISGDSR